MLEQEQSDIVVGVIDVGAPQNIGWAILADRMESTGRDLDAFVTEFADKANGRPAALGFEAPLFIPIGRPTTKLTAQRQGEAGRPWSAGAGATVTTIGLAVVAQVMAGLRPLLPNKRAALDWKEWPRRDDLLIFEAFVSGSNHAAPGDHHLDALNAARAFRVNCGDLDAVNAVFEPRVLSLVGACMARTGWEVGTTDLLAEPCLVIRPRPAEQRKQPERKEAPMAEHICICGCGGKTKGGKFLPGHDSKLRAAIEHAAGGLESLRAIVENHLGHPIEAHPKGKSK